MKHVILIHAHKDLGQLNALVGQLAGEEFSVWVNVDAKSDIDVARIAAPARVVRRRIPVYWADYSQVEATLNSLREIVAAEPEFGKVVLISGQDFPVLSNAGLHEALERSAGTELIECAPIGADGWDCRERYESFHWPRGGRAAMAAARLLARALRLAGVRRAMAGGMRPYGGSAWWALSRDCVQSVLGRVGQDPSLGRFFRTVACADELFFQTLVMASPFGAHVVSNNFRYVVWPDSGARNPKVLDASDYDGIASSGAHFCRKIEPAASAGLVDLLVRRRHTARA